MKLETNKMFKCKKKIIYPPEKFIKCNYTDDYKTSIRVDMCIADEIEMLWKNGIITCGCCCGHGLELGFIQVADEYIEKMELMGYEHYIYPERFGGIGRKDAFVPKTYGHIYDGYSEGFQG